MCRSSRGHLACLERVARRCMTNMARMWRWEGLEKAWLCFCVGKDRSRFLVALPCHIHNFSFDCTEQPFSRGRENYLSFHSQRWNLSNIQETKISFQNSFWLFESPLFAESALKKGGTKNRSIVQRFIRYKRRIFQLLFSVGPYKMRFHVIRWIWRAVHKDDLTLIVKEISPFTCF